MPLERFAAIRHEFDALASDDADVRLSASCHIVAELENAPAEDIKKAFDRLLKGLASGRRSARIGFSITLTELLSRAWTAGFENDSSEDEPLAQLLEALLSRTRTAGTVSGQEDRDHHLGRLFGLEAILKADIVLKLHNPRAGWDQILELIFDLAQRKVWLREECGWIVLETLKQTPYSKEGLVLAEVALEKLNSHNLMLSSEGVAIWLYIQTRHSNVELPKKPWHRRDLLHRKNLPELSRVLKDVRNSKEPATDNGANFKSAGIWNSRPHFVWRMLFDTLYERELSEPHEASSDKSFSFEQFWNTAVDESLFSASATPERKHCGFMLFAIIIDEAPPANMKAAFSQNMIRCLVNQLVDEDRYLHRMAVRTLSMLLAKVIENPDAAFDIVHGLLNGSKMTNFDSATKTKTFSSLLGTANESAMCKIVNWYSRLLFSPFKKDPKAAETQRQNLADQLISALRGRRLDEKAVAWVEPMLESFSGLGYFDNTDPELAPDPPFSSVSRELLRMKLSSCFALLLSTKVPSLTDLPYRVICQMKRQEKDTSSCLFTVQFDDATAKARRRSWKKMEKLNNQFDDPADPRQSHAKALKLLYSMVTFQLYNGDEDAVSVLSELDSCFDTNFGSGVKDDNRFSVTLVEILLSLVCKRSLLLRKVAQQAFAAFAGVLTLEGMQLFFKVLEAQESSAGQQSLFDQEQEASEDDVEMIDVDQASHQGKALPSDSSASTSDGSDGEDDEISGSEIESESASEDEETNGNSAFHNEEETAKLNAAIAQIVGTKPFKENLDGIEAESSDEETMDDDQMFALDDQVTTVFKERKKLLSRKNEKKGAKEAVLSFKNRVLDFVEIYFKQQHSNPIALHLIIPLLRLIRTTTSKQVSERACKVIREFAQRSKGKEITKLKEDEVASAWQVLADVHNEVGKDASKAHASACSQSSLLVAKALIEFDQDSVSDIVSRYANTQTSWLRGEFRVQPSFFSDFINWSVSFSKQTR